MCKSYLMFLQIHKARYKSNYQNKGVAIMVTTNEVVLILAEMCEAYILGENGGSSNDNESN